MNKEFNKINYENLFSGEISKRIYDILQKWMPFVDEQYADWDGRPNCGHFFGGSYFYGVETAFIMFLYAVMVKYGDYDEKITGISREELKSKVIKSIRYLCFTHDVGPSDCVREKSDNVYANGTKWGGKGDEFFRATAVGRTGALIALCALMFYDDIDKETMDIVEKIVENYSNRWSEELPRAGTYFDTQSEENAWTALGIAGGLVLYKKHPNREKWIEGFNRWCLNSIGTSKDRMNTDSFLGKSLRNFWMKGVTFHPDFTNENHSFLHPSYVCAAIILKFEAAVLLKMTCNTLPEGIFHNNELLYEKSLKKWFQSDGLLTPVQGQDWWYNRYHQEHFLHAIMSVTYDKDISTYFEKVNIEYMEKMQNSHKLGTLLEENPDQKIDEHGHYSLKMMEHANVMTIIYAFLFHTFFGEKETKLKLEDINKDLVGVYEFPFGGTVMNRRENNFTNFNWRNKVMGVNLPKDGMWTITPIVSSMTGEIYFENRVLAASLANERDIRDTSKRDINIKENGFGATCTVIRDDEKIIQDISFVSLPNGITIYTEDFNINKDFKVKEFHTGLIGVRNENIKEIGESAKGYKNIYTDNKVYKFIGYFGGEYDDIEYLEHTGYLNVDNKMGYVFYGGNQVKYINKHKYKAWKGVEDRLVFNNIEKKEFKKGENIKPLTLIAIPNVTAKETKKARSKCKLYNTSSKKTYVYEVDKFLITTNFMHNELFIEALYMHQNIINLYEGEMIINNHMVTRKLQLKGFNSEYYACVGTIEINNECNINITVLNDFLYVENLKNEVVSFLFNNINYSIKGKEIKKIHC